VRHRGLRTADCGLFGEALLLAMVVGCAGASRSSVPGSPKPIAVSESVVRSPQSAVTYLVFVASEGNDRISLVRFTTVCPDSPTGCARVEREHRVGMNPTELLGPHGIVVAPDGNSYYVTTAHGTPNGALWKFTTASDSLLGRVQLGAFPATVTISADGAYVYAVNFNLYGDPVTSSVSVVYGDQMVEVTRIPTCVMPHGSRLNAQGTRHYSVCMMNDMLIEIDTRQFGVARHFMLTRGSEHGMSGAPATTAQAGAHDMSGHGLAPAAPGDATCSPTWAQPSADGSRVYVACSKTSDIAEIDVASWTLKRRIPAGEGVYNLAATRDGRLLVGTNKRGQSVSVIDIATGKELARIPTTRKVVSGVAISPDDRYAFVTDEGVGSQPGTVDIIDLHSLGRVASVDVGQQAGGIDVWKTVPGK
jgi:DNA-binding beta-propeller fold protein YncE